MKLTEEQRKIIEETIINKSGKYSIAAVAGSGKSFTIFQAIDYIKEHEPNAKILYIVFNKANQLSAQQKLFKYALKFNPVEVSTAHSFAYRKWTSAFGRFEAKEKFEWSIIREIKEKHWKADVKYSKRKPFDWLLDKYCASKLILEDFCEDMKLHFDDDYDGPDKAEDIFIVNNKGTKLSKFGIQTDTYSYVSKEHIDVFKEVYEEHIKQKLFTHGMYLKHAAYSKKTGGSTYDYVFFDEAQDSNYFMLKLLEKQKIGKIYFVGDERQSIYKFGGSNENVFETYAFDKTYTLSKSFRFGDGVAKLANEIIHMHSSQTCYGTPQTHQNNPNSYARLYRTNAKLFKDALDLAYSYKCNGEKVKIDFMKGVDDDSYKYQELLSFLKIYYRSMHFSYYCNIKEAFPATVVPSLMSFEKLVLERGFLNAYNEMYDDLSDDIHSMYNYAVNEDAFLEKYNALKECLAEQDPEKIITMITMHRSKGLEWDNVVVAEPTKLYYEDKEGVIRRNSNYKQELNLAYVAITRARKFLSAIRLQDELCREDLKFEDMDFLIKEPDYIEEIPIEVTC